MTFRDKVFYIIIIFPALMLMCACERNYTPKPRAFYRITFPEKSYKNLNYELPYSFDIPVYSYVEHVDGYHSEPFWLTVKIPDNKAEIHISYKEVDNNLAVLTEESRSLVYKHSAKSSAIGERIFINDSEKVYGILYTIKGNAASLMQFYLTDSVRHFLRGALYIRAIPNIDSLRPVISFLEEDMIRMMETVEWKN